ncbi:MAG: hypothetical protein ACRBDI_03540 [Alphaproteobacteria bacterium]
MGSLSSSAKAPSTPQVIYTPAPTTNTIQEQPAQDSAKLAAEAREQSLLRRARGRLGTIATGLSGFLSDNNSNNSRKTLLGE